jgi:hypothetical protein
MEAKTCPSCRVSIVPTTDGRCPICHNELTAPPTAAPAGAPAAPANPFAAPTAGRPPEPAKVPSAKQPFSHQAARYALFTPLVLIVLNFAFKGQVDANLGTDLGRQLAVVWGSMSLLTIVTGFVFGVLGFIGGISRGAGWTIVIATIGLLLNGALLALAVYTVWLLQS